MSFFIVIFFVSVSLLFGVFAPVGFSFELEWFLFGLYFKIDFISKVFLIFSSFVWLIATLYGYTSITTHKNRFWFWFLLTFLGNMGLIVSYDVIGFYIFFTLMSLSAFGLVIHSQSQKAIQAAFIYIKYAIISEVSLFVAIIISTNSFENYSFEYITTMPPPLAVFLFIVGFGIKAGVFLLHFWLPYAHGNAPASASALLSGVMLKAGILGIIRYLPFGHEGDFLTGFFLICFGVFGIFFGAFGIFKKEIKVVLAYSSISQMGYIVTLLGLGLLEPKLWDSILLAILFFSLHHAINKSSLFLLAGEVLKNGLNIHYVILGLVFSLSLIGIPFTSGSLAKELFMGSISSYDLLVTILAPSSLITALLLIRVASLSKKIKREDADVRALYLIYPVSLVSLTLIHII